MRTALYRWFEQHSWAGDAILAGAVLIALGLNTVVFRYDYAAVLLLLACGVPLFVRRTHPEVALALSVGLLLLHLGLIDRPTVAVVLAPLMIHTAVVHLPSKVWGRVALGAGLAGSVLGPLRWYGRSDSTIVLMAVGLGALSVIAAFMVGERQRDRIDHQAEQVQALTERAVLLASEKDQRANVSAATERARIARELHDIVAHSLSVVIVQADGAAAAAAIRPEVAVSALQTIAETSREALTDMRRLVGVLRAGPDDLTTDYAPAQGVSDLPALVEQMRQAGVEVTFSSTGVSRPLPAGMGLTVYRLVQEALTNVLKHGGPAASAAVELVYLDARLQVGVSDDGRGAAAQDGSETGHGLLGMRERVQLHGGLLAVGPMIGGGFRVQAQFLVPTSTHIDGTATAVGATRPSAARPSTEAATG